jgi:hypothetical protein
MKVVSLRGIQLGSSAPSWSAYWKQQSECYELWKITDAGNLIGLKRGDILTVGGTVGSYTFQVPDSTPYKTYDIDNIFFQTDLTRRTTTEAELIGYDFARTIVKYLDVAPYSIEYIMILTSAPATVKENKMRDNFHLSVWWSNVLSSHGNWKGNRGTGQSVWVPGGISSAAIANATPTQINITFNAALDETSIPDASAFPLPGLPAKSITNIAIVGAVVTLTVDSRYYHYNIVTVGYIIPGSNFLKKATGEKVESFTAHAVTNNVTTTLLTGIADYWKLDEAVDDAIDVIGNYHLANTNVVQDSTGKVGKSFYYGGTANSIAANTLSFADTTSFSFAFWLKNDAINTTEEIIDRSAVIQSLIQVYKVNKDITFRIRGANGTGATLVTYTNGIADTNWMFVVGVRDHTSDKINIYINGVPWGTPVTDATTGIIGPLYLKLGTDQANTVPFHGYIDEFSIHTKALSNAEILELYNSGEGMTHPF